MSDIFISYAAEDRDKTQRLAAALEDQGWSVWWDRKILAGESFSGAIQREIDGSRCVVVLWSNSSVESQWVELEAARGNEQGKLVPALIEDVASRIPFEFSRIHAANLVSWNGDVRNSEYESLVAAISPHVPSGQQHPTALESDIRAKGGKGDPHVRRGSEAYQQGNFEDSIQEFQLALSQGVSRYPVEEVYTMLGNAYQETNLYDAAFAAHKKAIEINPNYHKAWVNIGIVYRLTGDLDEAERCYKKAISIHPKYAELHASLGALYIFRGDHRKAIQALEKSIALDPQLAVAHANLALALAQEGKFDAAYTALRQAVLLGYRRGKTIQERIDNLKSIAER